MKPNFLAILVFCSFSTSLWAQHSPLISNSYVSSFAVKRMKDSLKVTVEYARDGGTESTRIYAQLYILVYLLDDEKEIRELVQKEEYTRKDSENSSQLLDVLKRRKLAAILDSKVSDASEAYPADLPFDFRNKFEFEFSYDSILEKVSSLARYSNSKERRPPDRFGFIVFVPVNDSQYADKIPKHDDKLPDFVKDKSDKHFYDPYHIVQHFSILPYQARLYIPDASEKVSKRVWLNGLE